MEFRQFSSGKFTHLQCQPSFEFLNAKMALQRRCTVNADNMRFQCILIWRYFVAVRALNARFLVPLHMSIASLFGFKRITAYWTIGAWPFDSIVFHQMRSQTDLWTIDFCANVAHDFANTFVHILHMLRYSRFGVKTALRKGDQIHWYRGLLASCRGTLLPLWTNVASILLSFIHVGAQQVHSNLIPCRASLLAYVAFESFGLVLLHVRFEIGCRNKLFAALLAPAQDAKSW